MPYACWILRTLAASAFAPVVLALSAGRRMNCHQGVIRSGLSGSCHHAVAVIVSQLSRKHKFGRVGHSGRLHLPASRV
jgi:hypothetical protein